MSNVTVVLDPTDDSRMFLRVLTLRGVRTQDHSEMCENKSGARDGRLRLVHDGKHYDVTEFAQRHPGGKLVLQRYQGQDVTAVMKGPLHRHSPAAYSMLSQYCVEEIGGAADSNGNVKLHHRENGRHQEHLQHGSSKVTNGRMPSVGCSNRQREIESLIDWNKPLLGQVGQLGDLYDEWVHYPVEKPYRLFSSEVCEFFSRCPWFLVPTLWLPLVVYFAFTSVVELRQGQVQVFTQTCSALKFTAPVSLFPVVFAAGVMLWTFWEYCLHRFLFHSKAVTSSPGFIIAHFLLHGQHHKVPFDPGRLVFPPVPCSVFVTLFYVLYSLLLPRALVHALVSGKLCGYVCYDLTHYYLHHGSPREDSYFHRLKSYHAKHHFVHQETGFGISSRFWDRPFGTLIPGS
ncbi:fatty acid 2-hydroxylase-like isoform X1 [Branchiostoma floridae x Branchiostoma japonicum]